MNEFLDYTDFSGGMADIDTPNDRKHGERVENLNITPSGKLRLREGSEALDSDHNSIASGDVRENGRTGSIINYEQDKHLIVRSLDCLYAKNEASWTSGTAWTKIQGPNAGWNALPSYQSLTAALVVSHAAWQGHQILVGKDASTYISPQKVYLDENNEFKVLNASLPAPADPQSPQVYGVVAAACIEAANAIKAALYTHFSSTSHVYYLSYSLSTADAIFGADASDEASLITLTKSLIQAYNAHAQIDLLEVAGSGYYNHRLDQIYEGGFGFAADKGTAGLNYLLPTPALPESVYDCARLLTQLAYAVNFHIVSFMDPDDDVTEMPLDAVATFDNTNDRVTFAKANSYRTGDRIRFLGGTAPTGLTLGSTYYVVRVYSSGTTYATTYLKLASTFADAIAGNTIDFTTNGSGTIYAMRYHQNLHDEMTTMYAGSMLPVEGFYMYSSNAGGYAHLPASIATEVGALLVAMRSHLNSTPVNTNQHSVQNVQMYMGTDQELYNGADTSTITGAFSYDWQILASIIKAYQAYRMHRSEAANNLHPGAAGADTAGSSKALWLSRYLPDMYAAATWEIVQTLMTDLRTKLIAHAADGTRHIDTASWSSLVVSTYSFEQRRYAFVFAHKYKTYQNKTFETKSAPLLTDSYPFCFKATTNRAFAPAENHVYIYAAGVTASSQALLPPQGENYDFDNIDVEVYRTEDGGTTFYLAHRVSASKLETDTYLVDTSDDAGIVANAIELYTTGGVVGFDPVPRCKTVARVGDFLAYGGIVEQTDPDLTIVEFSTGTPGKVEKVAHGRSAGDAVSFSNFGFLNVLEIRPGKIYYVVNPTADDFELAESPGGTSLDITVSAPPYAPGNIYMASAKLIELKNRVRQSFPANGFSSPEDFYVDLESDVLQVARAQEHFIAVCNQGVYRLEGRFNEDGTGGMIAKQISERVSGVSALAGVTVRGLFFFMARDGFYMSDGYVVKPMTLHMQKMTSEAVSQDMHTFSDKDNGVQCAYEPTNNRILWCVDPAGVGYPTEFWVMHLSHSYENGAFTKWSNGAHFYPTAVAVFRGNVIRGDNQGFLFEHKASLKSDLGITRTGTGTLSGSVAKIPFLYRMLPEAFGNAGLRKWVAKVLVRLTNLGNITAALKSINDRNAANASSMTGIAYRSATYTGQIKELRTFPAGSAGVNYQGLRCHEKQLQIEYVDEAGTDTEDFELQSITLYHAPIAPQPNPPVAP